METADIINLIVIMTDEKKEEEKKKEYILYSVQLSTKGI